MFCVKIEYRKTQTNFGYALTHVDQKQDTSRNYNEIGRDKRC